MFSAIEKARRKYNASVRKSMGGALISTVMIFIENIIFKIVFIIVVILLLLFFIVLFLLLIYFAFEKEK